MICSTNHNIARSHSAPDDQQWHVLPSPWIFCCHSTFSGRAEHLFFNSFSVITLYYGPKPKITTPLTLWRKGRRWRTTDEKQLPPQPFSSDTEALGHGEDLLEPSLRDMMSILGNINARISATKNKVDKLSSHRVVLRKEEDPQPSSSPDITGRGHPTTATQDDQDDVLGIEDQVHARITEHLRGAPAAYLPTTDDEQMSIMGPQHCPARSQKDPRISWEQLIN